MPAVFPLRGIRYAPSAVGRVDRVVTPPYDVISPTSQDALYRRSSFNFIRVIYGRTRPTDRPGHDRYSRAHEAFRTWLRDGILRMDPTPACYPYRQRFLHEGQPFDRWGMIALIRLGEPTLFLHEETYPAPKEDRLQLLKAARANLSPIFGLVEDPDQSYRAALKRQAARPPVCSVVYEGVHHDVWRVTAPAALRTFQALLETRALLIADGHHRYESAAAYREELRHRQPSFTARHPANFVLAYVAAFPAHDPGLLPTHRVFDGLAGWSLDALTGCPAISVTRAADAAAMQRMVDGWADAERPAVGCYAGEDRWAVVTPARPDPSARLDVELLHRVIVPRCLATTGSPCGTPAQPAITYTQVWSEAVQQVADGRGQVAWYLRPLTLAQILWCVRDGRRLPQKSTYFVPKPLSGLVIHRLQPAGALPHRGVAQAQQETGGRGGQRDLSTRPGGHPSRLSPAALTTE